MMRRDVVLFRIFCVLICFLTTCQNVLFFYLNMHTIAMPVSKQNKSQIIPYSYMSKYKTMTEDIQNMFIQYRCNKTINLPNIFKYSANIRNNPAKIYQFDNTGQISKVIHKMFIVKSSIGNFKIRETIRRTWGNYTRTVFVVGKSIDQHITFQLQKEINQNNDILQIDIFETYFGNIYKTLNAVRWVVKYFSLTKYVVFVDDDFFINPKELERIIYRHSNIQNLYLGHEGNRNPVRKKDIKNHRKWYITIGEYPFELYPPYIIAGFMVISMNVLKQFSLISSYVQHIRFDDVYLGILAHKLNITPIYTRDIITPYCFENKFVKYLRNMIHNFVYGKQYLCSVLASHCFGDSYDLERTWDSCQT